MKDTLKKIFSVYMVRRGKKREFKPEQLEIKHVEKSKRSFNDSSYFAGISSEGYAFVTRQAFRVDKPNENWMMVSIPGEGVWGFENRELEEGEGFKQGSLEYRCEKPAESWKIMFDGKLPKGGEQADFSMDLEWKAVAPIVVFDKVGTTPLQVGKQLAREKWNRHFFNKLREIDQVHYEQAGTLSGTFTWKGKEKQLEFVGVRDHSWGVRNWEDWDRHFWLLGLLEDGRFFNFSLISYSFVKNLQAAFIFDKEAYRTIYRIPSFDELNLNPMLPKTLSFDVLETRKGPVKKLKVNMLNFFPFHMDEIYYLRQAEAAFEYDGVKGVGIAEMGANLTKYDIDVPSTY
jgi:hypothetical protein